MAMTKAERDRITAQAKLEAAREKESDEQKWMRQAIGETVEEKLREIFDLDDDDDADSDKPKGSGGNVSFIDQLLGKTKTG